MWFVKLCGSTKPREAFDEEGRARDPVINRRLQMLGVEVARASAMFAVHWLVE